MEITPGCKLTCSKVLTDIVTCGTKTIGNRTLLNVLYFLFRYVLSKHVHAYLTIFLTIEWWDFKTWDVMKHFFCNNNSVILLTSSKFDNSGFFYKCFDICFEWQNQSWTIGKSTLFSKSIPNHIEFLLCCMLSQLTARISFYWFKKTTTINNKKIDQFKMSDKFFHSKAKIWIKILIVNGELQNCCYIQSS